MATSNVDSTREAGARFPAIIQKIRSVETVTVAGLGLVRRCDSPSTRDSPGLDGSRND